MSIDAKVGRFCDECGRTTHNIKRIYRGKDFCGTCYPRVFIHRNCSKCNTLTRAHRNEALPLCRPCNTAIRKCLRCEKPVPQAGIRVGDQVACPSCAVYFREQKPCPSCGALSGRLSRAKLFGFDEPTCDACRGAAIQQTCKRCRKSRTVAFQTLEGEPYCKGCVPGAEVSHACPKCTAEVVGDGMAVCRACYTADAVRSSAQLASATLESQRIRCLYLGYCEWLLEKHPAKPKLNRMAEGHVAFFARLDVTFGDAAPLSRKEMLKQMGTTYLRRYLLASRYVVQHGIDDVAPQELQDASEQLIVKNKLAALARKEFGPVLQGFVDWLDHRKAKIRTIRLYLRAAEKFCSYGKQTSMPPSQQKLESFVVSHRGSRNSLAAFIKFGRQKLDWNVTLPPVQRSGKPPATIPRIAALANQISSNGIGNVGEDVLRRMLATALGFQLRNVNSNSILQLDTGEYVLRVESEEIALPEQLAQYAAELVRRRTL